MEQEPKDQLTGLALEIEDKAQEYLESASKWTKFLAIIMIVASIFLLIGFFIFLLMGDEVARNTAAFSSITYLYLYKNVFLIGLLVFLIIMVAFIILLYRFSLQIQKGVRQKEVAFIEQGISSLKLYMIGFGSFMIFVILLRIYSFIKF